MRKLTLFIPILFLLSCKERFYKAGAGSMEETIKVGDRFVVTQTDKFERNDIVVFDYFGPDYTSMPDENGKLANHWEKIVFRLIAYSGDSVEIKKGDVFVNGQLVPLPPKAKMRYEVLSTVPIAEFNEMDPYIVMTTKSGDTMEYKVELTTEQVRSYRQREPAIIKVKKLPPAHEPNISPYTRASATGNWSSYNYGPLKIPSPGETINIDSVNFSLYQNIPGIMMGNYLLKEKLYFVLGDNRYGAADSRFIGLIAYSKMNGIVK